MALFPRGVSVLHRWGTKYRRVDAAWKSRAGTVQWHYWWISYLHTHFIDCGPSMHGVIWAQPWKNEVFWINGPRSALSTLMPGRGSRNVPLYQVDKDCFSTWQNVGSDNDHDRPWRNGLMISFVQPTTHFKHLTDTLFEREEVWRSALRPEKEAWGISQDFERLPGSLKLKKLDTVICMQWGKNPASD